MMAHASEATTKSSQLSGTSADRLPPENTRHWLPGHKAAIVAAVASGSIGVAEVCRRYLLTPEELLSWKRTFDEHGITGLHAKRPGERRREERREVEEPAVVRVHDACLDCLIKDVSAAGARLEFGRVVLLPASFELECASSGRSVLASTIWQRERLMGVRFETSAGPDDAAMFRPGFGLLGRDAGEAISQVFGPPAP